jgi:hypothetical protein
MIGGTIGGGIYEAFGRCTVQGLACSDQALFAFAVSLVGGGIGFGAAFANLTAVPIAGQAKMHSSTKLNTPKRMALTSRSNADYRTHNTQQRMT